MLALRLSFPQLSHPSGLFEVNLILLGFSSWVVSSVTGLYLESAIDRRLGEPWPSAEIQALEVSFFPHETPP